MKLYHGSPINNIKKLKPFISNHNNAYVYATDNYILSILYSYNPLTRPNGFYTYFFNKDNQLVYEEYFHDQLKEIYKGKTGYIYEIKDNNFTKLENIPWIYIAEKEIQTNRTIVIKDIYEEIIKLENEGKIIILRYQDQDEKQRKQNEKIIQNEIIKTPKSNTNYLSFLNSNFPNLFK